MENTQGEKKCECCGGTGTCSCDLGKGTCNCGSCGKDCNCPHHKAVPVFIVLIAIAFLLQAWGLVMDSTVSVIWPILLAAIGISKLMEGRCSCC
jgi:hypothetical protein